MGTRTGTAMGIALVSLLATQVRADPKGIDWRQVLEPSCWPYEQARAGDVTFFTVRCRSTGEASLWRLDREASAPVRVVTVPHSAWHLTAMGDAVYFGATDMKHGYELWKAIPSEGRAFMLEDIHPTTGSNPWPVGVAGGVLLLVAWHPEHGRSFYASDGSPQGTAFLKSVGDDQALPFSLGPSGTRLRFFTRHRTRKSAYPGTAFKHNRLLLWESDGTREGTREVREMRIENSRETYAEPTSMGGTLYWLHRMPGNRGTFLWRSDGTPKGTQEVFRLKVHEGTPQSMAAAGDRLFLAVRTYHGFKLWASDGTREGTRLVREWKLPRTKGWRKPAPVERLVNSCDELFITARTGERGGLELWTSDGTPQGTQVVLGERNKQLDIPYPKRFFGPRCVAGHHFLWVEDHRAASGLPTPGKKQNIELVLTDGTPAGTRLVWHWER